MTRRRKARVPERAILQLECCEVRAVPSSTALTAIVPSTTLVQTRPETESPGETYSTPAAGQDQSAAQTAATNTAPADSSASSANSTGSATGNSEYSKGTVASNSTASSSYATARNGSYVSSTYSTPVAISAVAINDVVGVIADAGRHVRPPLPLIVRPATGADTGSTTKEEAAPAIPAGEDSLRHSPVQSSRDVEAAPEIPFVSFDASAVEPDVTQPSPEKAAAEEAPAEPPPERPGLIASLREWAPPGVDVGELASRFAPFDSKTLESAVDRFLGRLGDDDSAGGRISTPMVAAALAATLTAGAVARRKQVPQRVSRFLAHAVWSAGAPLE